MPEEKTMTMEPSSVAAKAATPSPMDGGRLLGAETEGLIRTMAGMIADMRQDMLALQAKVAMLEKLTPMQVKDVNLRIRERAVQLEAGYGLPEGSAEKLTTLIRRQVRMETGARSTRDIARCDYPVVCEMISDWEDWQAISAMR